MVNQRVRTLVRVSGIVQGMGFRPFVYSLACGPELGGLVGNDMDGVFAEGSAYSTTTRTSRPAWPTMAGPVRPVPTAWPESSG